jgi:hypothetical protein
MTAAQRRDLHTVLQCEQRGCGSGKPRSPQYDPFQSV